MAKLVRDRIPVILEARGVTVVTRVLEPDEFGHALREKLLEEAEEAATATNDDLPLELADCLEVLRALAEEIGVTWASVERAATAKREERGGFAKRLWLEDPAG